MPLRDTRCLVPEESGTMRSRRLGTVRGEGRSSDRYPHTMIEDNDRHVKENPSTHKM